MRSPQIRPTAAAAAGLLALWLPACGWMIPAAAVAGPDPASARLAQVEIVDRTTGERLPVYGHRGERWVAGVPGHRYAISVLNQAGGRLLAVMSVDGLNVLSGETAGWDQGGYVFAPGERYDVAGWRKSQERIAAFEFASLPDSYAARTGRPQNVGVIGLALFREAPPAAASVAPAPAEPLSRLGADRERQDSSDQPRPVDQMQSRSEAAASGAIKRSEDKTRLGTAHGRSESSWVAFTSFERAQASPDEVITIRYDRRENLIAMGVIAAPVAAPNPFPSSILGFVPDPPAR